MDVHEADPDTGRMTGVGIMNTTRRTFTGTSVRVASLALALALAAGAAPALGGSAHAAHAARAAQAATAAVDDALTGLRHGLVRIIVQKHDAPASTTAGAAATSGAVELAVSRLGGQVTVDLPIVNGFAATVPAESIGALARTPGVRVISLDRKMTVQATASTGTSTVKSVYRKTVRADDLNTAGYTGRGVTVALIDTGVTGVSDLAGRILPVTDDVTGVVTACQNMSGESTCDDSYGHGTFVAGIIAGNGAASAGAYKGVAPEANILSVKIAGRSGAADVSNVLAAIQWVVNFKDRYGVKVLNLSLGTDSTQSYRVDPMNFAVEKAWQAGITVVVSASNRGPDPRTISKPGDDPFVITVGAVDDRGTSATSDDSLPNFSSRGPTAADGLPKPDVTAPGAHVVSLRAPGSAVDQNFPNYVDGAYRKGSGTSFSAGVVSGAAALIAQANPVATPDRIKYALTSTARRVASTDAMAVGAGEIDASAAALSAPPGLANQGVEPGNGSGSIDLSRGSVYVTADDPMQTLVNGSLTMQLLLYDPVGYLLDINWLGGNWYGGNWYGGNWYGQTDGGNWYGGNWYGSAWYGAWE